MVDTSSPKDGVRKEVLDESEAPKKLNMSQNELYASTKAASYFLATEFSRREPKTGGVIHIAGNPGNYATNLWTYVRLHLYLSRSPTPSTLESGMEMVFSLDSFHSQRQQVPTLLYTLLRPVLRNPSPHGADTWLWMGLSDEVTLDDVAAGRYAMCDGRWHPGQRGDLVAALRPVSEGGSGRAREVYEWCEKQVAEYLH